MLNTFSHNAMGLTFFGKFVPSPSQEMNIAVQIRTMGAILSPVAVVLRFHGCIPASVA